MKVFVLAVLVIAALAQGASIPKEHARFFEPPLYKISNNPDGRIFNGVNATLGEIPWQVYLIIGSGSFCGGLIIRENVVLTAGHCTTGAKTITAYAGTLLSDRSEGQKLTATGQNINIFTHPDYNPNTLKADIGLLIFPEKFTINDNVKPATLDDTNNCTNAFNKKVLGISGWGKRSDAILGGISRFLLRANVTGTENIVCENYYNETVLPKEIICVPPAIYANSTGHSTTCSGDSGGPLYGYEKQRVVGLVSFGSSEGCDDGPTGFTCIGPYLSWIEKTIADHPQV